MLLSPDVVLALLYAAQAQDQYALLNVLASSVLVYALCGAAMRRAPSWRAARYPCSSTSTTR
jgi:hypothetical protein